MVSPGDSAAALHFLRRLRRHENLKNLETVLESTDSPSLDVFVCTADPYKEPPMRVVNTALSVMGYEYPTDKISVYVSDDGGSALTLYAFVEAARFAAHWLPFCRKRNVMDRSPETYFSSNDELLRRCSEIENIKIMYESMKVRVEQALEIGRISDELLMDDQDRQIFNKWTDPGFTRQNHSSMIQVLLESGKNRDILCQILFMFPEKKERADHIISKLVLSMLLFGFMPLIMTLDCDTYSNDPNTPSRVLCYFSDPQLSHDLAYVQFPQCFHGINERDIYPLMGFRYGSLVEDFNTGYALQCEGWRAIFCDPQRPAFYGGIPITLIDTLTQVKRCSIGLTKVGPLMALTYGHYSFWPIWSFPMMTYAFLPQLSLLNGLIIFPKVSDPMFLLYTFLVLGSYAQHYVDITLNGGTFKRWFNDQRMWMIRCVTSFLFGSAEFLLNSSGFTVTTKVVDDEQSKRYDLGLFEFGVASPMFVSLTMVAIINLVSFLWGIKVVVRGEGLDFVPQIAVSGFVVLNCWPVYEAMVLRSDKGKIPMKISLISAFLVLVLCKIFAFIIGN